MPSRKKKYNARFPAGRIKKIMQMDDDVGKIAHAVPVVISRSVELFINSLLQQTATITRERNAKTLSLSHTKQCVLKHQKFEFLKDLVKNIDDISPEEEKKASRNHPITPTLAHPEVSERNHETSRKRIKSEPLSDASSSASLNGSRKPVKRRYSLEQSCNAVDSNNLSERESTSCSAESQSSADGADNEVRIKSESFSSCDLIIDEDSET